MRFFVTQILILALCVVALPAQAQLGSTAPLYLVLSPEFPRPFSTVTVSVRSDTIDLYSSIVTVRVNGEVVEEGSGVVNAVFTVAGPGQTSTVVATAVNQGRTYTTQMTIRPADVALIVEPLTTAHPLYKGGNLVASEGRLRIIAMPELQTAAGTPLAPQNLVYTWRLGNQVLQSASGIGKNVLTATAPVRYRDAVVSVTVATQDQSVVAQSSALISPVDPVVRIYRSDPLLGIDFANAVSDSVVLRGSEDSFRVVPFFFSGLPSISWSVNDVVNETANTITLRSTGSGGGSALLGVRAQLSSNFQIAEDSVTVRFGETGGFNFFGL